MIKKLGFFSAFLFPAFVIIGFYQGGFWNYMALVYAFVLLPIMDAMIGIDKSNVSDNQIKIISAEYYYRFITFIWTYAQVAFVIWGCYVFALNSWSGWTEIIGFVLGFSLVTGGIGITVAHELGHKKEAIERFYSKLLLMTVSYMHFYIEHNKGHHVHVATPVDPATSRKNETFYRFWLRSVGHGYVHAWRIENERLNRNGYSIFSYKNSMIWYTIMPFLFIGFIALFLSLLLGSSIWPIVAFFFAQSFFAFTLLELVNYVEHYGIERKEISPGKYERVNPMHSWNSSHLISNFFLFQLQRHSDHHANAIKRYQVLNHYDESPQLPAGYSTMIILALVPPLWFAFMNQRLEKWHESYNVSIE